MNWDHPAERAYPVQHGIDVFWIGNAGAAYLCDDADTGLVHFGKIVLGKSFLEDHRSAVHLQTATGTEVLVGVGKQHRWRFGALCSLRAALQIRRALADRSRHATVQNAFERPEYCLTWVPVADNKMNVRIDQTWQHRHLLGVDHRIAFPDLEIAFHADVGDSAIGDQDGVAGEHGFVQVSRHDRADIFDDGFHHRILLQDRKLNRHFLYNLVYNNWQGDHASLKEL